MTFLATGLLTVGLVYVINKAILTPLTKSKIVVIIPLIEEATKTLLPLWGGSSILLNHAFFGAGEALLDYWTSKKRSSLLAFAGFLGHLFFGYLTLLGIKQFGYSIIGVMFGYLPHLAWNFVVVKMGEY